MTLSYIWSSPTLRSRVCNNRQQQHIEWNCYTSGVEVKILINNKHVAQFGREPIITEEVVTTSISHVICCHVTTNNKITWQWRSADADPEDGRIKTLQTLVSDSEGSGRWSVYLCVRMWIPVLPCEFIKHMSVLFVDLLHLIDVFSHCFHAPQSLYNTPQTSSTTLSHHLTHCSHHLSQHSYILTYHRHHPTHCSHHLPHHSHNLTHQSHHLWWSNTISHNLTQCSHHLSHQSYSNISLSPSNTLQSSSNTLQS